MAWRAHLKPIAEIRELQSNICFNIEKCTTVEEIVELCTNLPRINNSKTSYVSKMARLLDFLALFNSELPPEVDWKRPNKKIKAKVIIVVAEMRKTTTPAKDFDELKSRLVDGLAYPRRLEKQKEVLKKAAYPYMSGNQARIKRKREEETQKKEEEERKKAADDTQGDDTDETEVDVSGDDENDSDGTEEQSVEC